MGLSAGHALSGYASQTSWAASAASRHAHATSHGPKGCRYWTTPARSIVPSNAQHRLSRSRRASSLISHIGPGRLSPPSHTAMRECSGRTSAAGWQRCPGWRVSGIWPVGRHLCDAPSTREMLGGRIAGVVCADDDALDGQSTLAAASFVMLASHLLGKNIQCPSSHRCQLTGLPAY